MAKPSIWPPIIDEALVERMIPAVQQAIIEATIGTDRERPPTEMVELNAPDVANVLLMVLATVLEPAPGCATAQGIRVTGEAAGRELAELIRDTRRLKQAGEAEPRTVQ